METQRTIKVLSGVYEIRPTKLLTLNVAGMVSLTPKQIYHAFKTDFKLKIGDRETCIFIVKNNLRWIPVIETYARNNFDYLSNTPIENQTEWMNNFSKRNEHIRTKEHLNVELKDSK